VKKVQTNLRERTGLVECDNETLSISRQCELLSVNRSSVYYQKVEKNDEKELEEAIMMIYLKRPFYGYRRIAEELKRNDHQVNRKRVRRIMHNLNIRAIYPKLNLSIPNKQHKKYPYLLSGMRIDHVNQVWASDITYLRLKR